MATPCPCGSAADYSDCCAIYHHQPRQTAPTAEALMRSRYSAYVNGLTDYLLQTWHPTTRPMSLVLEPKINWLGLSIKHVLAGQAGDSHGSVEFIARSKLNGKASRLHELSQFTFENGRWYYVSGEIR